MFNVTVKIDDKRGVIRPDKEFRVSKQSRKDAKREALERTISELPDGEYILNFDVVEVAR